MAIRIGIGLVLAILFLSALYFGASAILVLFTAAALIAVHELGRAFHNRAQHVFLAPAFLCALLLAPWLVLLEGIPLVFLWMCGITAVIIERVLRKTRSTDACFYGLLLFAYPLPMFAVLLLLPLRFGETLGITAMLAAVGCPLLGDVLAYFVGTLWGRHKLCPDISPNKTIEGSIACIAGSILASVIIYMLQQGWGASFPLPPLLVIGFLCGILGQIGDLFASIVKRWAAIKDFGTIFPGHGGVMDRLDSVLFCAPVVYACFLFISAKTGL